MKLSRRDFLRLASFTTLGAVACNFFDEREFTAQSPVQLPEDLVTGRDNWYATLCRQCPETEGLIVRIMEGRAKKVQGNPLYPTNLGGHSVRCEAGLQALYHPERIAGPMVREGPRGNGMYRSVQWDEALDILLRRLQEQQDRSRVLTVTGPLRGSLAHLTNSFTSAYGGRHMAFQPMEEASYDRVMREVLGQETMPTFDIKNTRYLLSFGADFLSTWRGPGAVLQGLRRVPARPWQGKRHPCTGRPKILHDRGQRRQVGPHRPRHGGQAGAEHSPRHNFGRLWLTRRALTK